MFIYSKPCVIDEWDNRGYIGPRDIREEKSRIIPKPKERDFLTEDDFKI